MNDDLNPWENAREERRHTRSHRRRHGMRGDAHPDDTGGRFEQSDAFGPPVPFGPDSPRFPHGGGRRRNRARRGAIRLAVLSLLTEQSMNGYQMIQTLAERTNGMWNPSPGSIYPTLAQLADEGLIEPTDESGQRMYRLTQSGILEAGNVTHKPWEAIGQDDTDPTPEGDRKLWHEYGQLALAARAALASADSGIIEAAAMQISMARRKIYESLARHPEPENE